MKHYEKSMKNMKNVCVFFTFRKIHTHLEYLLPFTAMDEVPAYVIGHLISPKNQKHTIFHIRKTN